MIWPFHRRLPSSQFDLASVVLMQYCRYMVDSQADGFCAIFDEIKKLVSIEVSILRLLVVED